MALQQSSATRPRPGQLGTLSGRMQRTTIILWNSVVLEFHGSGSGVLCGSGLLYTSSHSGRLDWKLGRKSGADSRKVR